MFLVRRKTIQAQEHIRLAPDSSVII